MDFAILSSICVYLMLISIYVFKSFYQCCFIEPRRIGVEEGLEMMPVEQPTDAFERDQIHEV